MIGAVMGVGYGAAYALARSASDVQAAMARLSSGKRINSAADDAAGLSTATALTTQARGLTVAARGVQEMVAQLTTIDGALGTVTNILQRLRDLSVQAGNGALSADPQNALNAETQQDIAQIAATLQLHLAGRAVFAGEPGTAVAYQAPVAPTPPAPATAATLTGSAFGSFTVTASGGATGTTSGSSGTPAATGDDLTITTAGESVTLHLAAGTYTTAQDALAAVKSAWTTAVGGGNGTLMSAVAGVTFGLTSGGALTVSAGDTGATSSVTVTGGAAGVLGLSSPTLTPGADAVAGTPGTPEVPAQPAKPLALRVQLGAYADDGVNVMVPLLDTTQLGLDTWTPSTAGLSVIDDALATVLSARTSLGAQANALTRSVDVSQVAANGLTDAASRISDADLGVNAVQLALARNRFSAGVAAASVAKAAHANMIAQLLNAADPAKPRRGSIVDVAA